MRKAIARRLVTSIGPVPHFFLTIEVDMGRILELRKAMNGRLESGKIGVNDILVKVTAEALARHPEINASWQGDTIRRHGFDISSVGTIAGASGGAKWLVLSQLDRAILGSVVPKLSGPVHLIGSSIGSWRFACYAQADPLAAIERFEQDPAVGRVIVMTNGRQRGLSQVIGQGNKPFTTRRRLGLDDGSGPVLVVGDQVLTDGLLAWRLRATYLHLVVDEATEDTQQARMRRIGRLAAMETLDDLLECIRGELGVGGHARLGTELLENFFVRLIGIAEHHRTEHLDETPV